MTGFNSLVRRYAKALFRVAVEKKKIENIRHDLTVFSEVLQLNPALDKYLLSPEISREEKEKTIQKLLGDQLSSEFLNFLRVLLRKGRMNFFSQMAEAYFHYQDEYFNRVRVVATTAVPLSEKDWERIQKRLSDTFHKEVILEPAVDPAILGGIRIQMDSTVYDASLLGQMERMRAYLAQKPDEQNN